MPTNLYGPGDNYHPTNSHVIPALIRRFHEAREAGSPSVTIWGTGSVRREFLHVDDLAEALVMLLQVFDEPGPINVGYGDDLPIIDVVRQIAKLTGFEGKIELDTSKPDGTPRKLMDNGRMAALGWKPKIDLEAGLQNAYSWFIEHGLNVEAATA